MIIKVIIIYIIITKITALAFSSFLFPTSSPPGPEPATIIFPPPKSVPHLIFLPKTRNFAASCIRHSFREGGYTFTHKHIYTFTLPYT